jgi:hypothetical protein
MRVLTRVDALRAVRDEFAGVTAGVLNEYVFSGTFLEDDWAALAHGDRPITARDRLGTARFEEEVDILLEIVRFSPELIAHDSGVDELRYEIAKRSRLPPFSNPMYSEVSSETCSSAWEVASTPHLRRHPS